MVRQSADELVVIARHEPLFRWLSAGPRGRDDLARDLGVSGSTVDRRLRDFESRGYVERVAGGYRLTLQGRLALAVYRQFVELQEAIGAAVPLTAALPADCELAPDALVGAEVIVADPPAPDRPVERHLDRIRGADRVRALGTAIAPRYVQAYHEWVMAGELEVQAAIARPVLRELLANYRGQVEVGFDTDRVTLRALDDPPPFSLFLLDGDERRLGVMVYAGDAVRGYVDNDRQEAVEWGERLFERYWEGADPLAPP